MARARIIRAGDSTHTTCLSVSHLLLLMHRRSCSDGTDGLISLVMRWLGIPSLQRRRAGDGVCLLPLDMVWVIAVVWPWAMDAEEGEWFLGGVPLYGVVSVVDQKGSEALVVCLPSPASLYFPFLVPSHRRYLSPCADFHCSLTLWKGRSCRRWLSSFLLQGCYKSWAIKRVRVSVEKA